MLRTVLKLEHLVITVQRCDTRWTPEEDEMIREWPASEEDSFFDVSIDRLSGQRNRQSLIISSDGRKYEALRSKVTEKWQCRWSAEEDEFIITWPAENLIACEIAFQKRVPK